MAVNQGDNSAKVKKPAYVPGPAGFLLATRLRMYRERAGLTREDLTALHMGSSVRWYRFETGRARATVEAVTNACRIYKLNEAESADLISLAERAGQETWTEDDGLSIDTTLPTYLGCEAIAESIDITAPYLISGLLQTEDYIRATTEAQVDLTTSGLDRVIALRQERQRQVIGRAHVRVALGEEALVRQIGSPDVMATQISHLRSLEHHGVEIRILRLSLGPHVATRGEDIILRFDPATAQDPFIYTQGYQGGQFSSAAKHIRDAEERFEMMWTRCVPISQF